MASVGEESFAAPMWNGGLLTRRSTELGPVPASMSAWRTRTLPLLARAVSRVDATAKADTSVAVVSQPRWASQAAMMPEPQPTSGATPRC